MVVSCHDEAFSLDKPVVTKELVEQVLKRFKTQQSDNVDWSLEAEAYLELTKPKKYAE